MGLGGKRPGAGRKSGEAWKSKKINYRELDNELLNRPPYKVELWTADGRSECPRVPYGLVACTQNPLLVSTTCAFVKPAAVSVSVSP
jgi:hypothetical protein